MKAAVIGAGFVGVELAKYLIQAGHEAILLNPVTRPDTGMPFFECDVLQGEITFPQNLDAVFYLAQSPHYREFPKHAGHLFGVNTLGAIKAAEAALHAGCRFFFYASTGSVYAPSFSPLSEQSPTQAADAYTLSKYMTEEALALFPRAMRICTGRIFGVFGPGQKKMLPALIRDRLILQTPIQLALHPVHGPDGGLRISFIYNHDLAAILAGLAENALRGEDVPLRLNLAGPEAFSLEHFAAAMGKALKTEPVFENSSAPRGFDLVADITLLNATLAPAFTPLDEALDCVAAFSAP
jgi:nucleoside-diphosphate-sugar epimerase